MARGQIEVAGAFYEIGSGAVDFVDTDWKSSPRVMPIEKLSGFN